MFYVGYKYFVLISKCMGARVNLIGLKIADERVGASVFGESGCHQIVVSSERIRNKLGKKNRWKVLYSL